MRVDRQTKRLALVVCLTAALHATTSFALAATAAPAVVARVNGAPIFDNQLPPVSEVRIAQYRNLGARSSEAELKRSLQRKDLEELIGLELLAQAGASLGPKDLDQRVEKRLAAAGKGQKEQQENVLRDKLRREILKEDLLEHKGLLNIKPDEQELRRFYEANKKSFTEPKSVRVRHILVQLPKGASAKQEQEARKKAEKILAEVRNGKSFAVAAGEYSDCSTKKSGGDLGFIRPGFMPGEFDSLAFRLKPGEIGEVVKTRFGFHIIQAEEVRPEKVNEYAKVREYIAGYVKKENQRRKIEELLGELRKTAKIEILFN